MGSNNNPREGAPVAHPSSKDPSSPPLHVLCLDQNAADRRILSEYLTKNWSDPVDFMSCDTLLDALELEPSPFDFLIFDIESIAENHSDRPPAIEKLLRRFGGTLLLACSQNGSVSAAVAAMQAGAHDFMPKPLAGKKLIERMQALQNCMQSDQMKARATPQIVAEAPVLATSEPVDHAEQLASQNEHAFDFEGFIGQSPQMCAIYDQIDRIAPSNAPVFITGESGTGKEVCALALHARSGRGDAPMIAINCGAIPKDLMEAEIFGAVRGAYTGAHADRMGAAEQANGGTLFLDEIGELDMSLQAKLLRFLQTGAITRVGEAISRTLDVRIICATNRAPVEMIQQGQFRQDLFYRLHVLPIHLPPLRQRPGDILPVARSFLAHCVEAEGRAFSSFSDQCELALQVHSWPGNVRELQNLIRRAVVMNDGGVLTHDMLRLDGSAPGMAMGMGQVEGVTSLADHQQVAQPVVEGFADFSNLRNNKIEPMWMQEKRIIEQAMALFSGNAAKAAAALEISPSTIYRKKQYWLEKGAA